MIPAVLKSISVFILSMLNNIQLGFATKNKFSTGKHFTNHKQTKIEELTKLWTDTDTSTIIMIIMRNSDKLLL